MRAGGQFLSESAYRAWPARQVSRRNSRVFEIAAARRRASRRGHAGRVHGSHGGSRLLHNAVKLAQLPAPRPRRDGGASIPPSPVAWPALLQLGVADDAGRQRHQGARDQAKRFKRKMKFDVARLTRPPGQEQVDSAAPVALR